MSLRNQMGVFAMALLLGSGCGNVDIQDPQEVQNVEKPLGMCGKGRICTPTDPNGTGVNIGNTDPRSKFGIYYTDGRAINVEFWLTGLSGNAKDGYQVIGYTKDLGGQIIQAKAIVTGITFDTRPSWQVESLSADKTELSAKIFDTATNQQFAVSGGDMVGLNIALLLPGTGTSAAPIYAFVVRVDGVDKVPSQADTVYGFRMSYRPDFGSTQVWAPFCKGPQGQSELSVWYLGAVWEPMTGKKLISGKEFNAVTCETGGIAVCLGWGYQPWNYARYASTGQDESLEAYHQTCIHMKRASYCANEDAFTVNGTLIEINDPFAPQIHSSPLNTIEAVWTETGATCLTNPRHPALLSPSFVSNGCGNGPLPVCTASAFSGAWLATGLP